MKALNEKAVLLVTLAACMLFGGGTFLFLTRNHHLQPPPPPAQPSASFEAATPPPKPAGSPAQKMVDAAALDFARKTNLNQIADQIERHDQTPHAAKPETPVWNNEELNNREFQNMGQVAGFANQHGYLITGNFLRSRWPAKVVSITDTNNSISFQLKDGQRHDYLNFQGYSLKLLRLEDADGHESAILLRSKVRVYSGGQYSAPSNQPIDSAVNAAIGNGNFRVAQRLLAQKFQSEQRDLGATNAQTLQTLQRLTDVSGCAGDWAGCVRYSQMLMVQTNDLLVLRGCAVAALLAGDLQTYREVCSRLLSEFGTTPSPLNAERIAKVCLLAPGSVPDLSPVWQLADLAFKAHPDANWFILVKGLAEFRSGQSRETIQTLDGLRKDSNPDIASMAGFLMAMAYQQMNQAEEAKTLLAGANQRQHQSNSMVRRDEKRWWFDFAAATAIGAEANKMILGR